MLFLKQNCLRTSHSFFNYRSIGQKSIFFEFDIFRILNRRWSTSQLSKYSQVYNTTIIAGLKDWYINCHPGRTYIKVTLAFAFGRIYFAAITFWKGAITFCNYTAFAAHLAWLLALNSQQPLTFDFSLGHIRWYSFSTSTIHNEAQMINESFKNPHYVLLNFWCFSTIC